MTAVFVHGVPETPELWDPIRSHLHRKDVVALQLPGFGCPRPEGFAATKEDYVASLVAELERLAAEDAIDLVGHDWGGGFVVRLVSTRVELVRTWAGVGDVNFAWHEFAKIWQTPGAGEDFWKDQLAQPREVQASVFEMFGVPHDQAMTMAGWADETMAACILDLYRSAVDVGREWGPDFQNVGAPGLVFVASEDQFLSPEKSRNGASRAGAEVAELDGLGHWWALQDPARAAAVLEEFWAAAG